MALTHYRDRTLDHLVAALRAAGELKLALDFGSGDGFFCHHLERLGAIERISPIDVVERKRSFVRPQLYDGRRLPFADASFDLCYAVDVVHHCPDPLNALAEMSRCTRRWLLLKDHNCEGPIGHLTLSLLDEVGNRRFGIPSPGRYQRNWAWANWLEARGFERFYWAHPVPSHVGLLGRATNNLQFIGLWRRQ
jgi:SAM-dependent methyltransferase